MTRPRKRAYENSDISSTRSVSKDDLIILQPACKLQDLKIQDTIEEVLRTNLCDVSFASWDSEARCDALSTIIQQKLCGIQHQFSDLAVVVLIGGVDDTGIVKASHKVWKPEYDSFASAWYKNDSLFAVGTVFATYATRNIWGKCKTKNFYNTRWCSHFDDTVKPRYNKPLYHEVLGITEDYLQ